MEAELARVTAEIKASEAREVAVQQRAVEKAQAAENAKAEAEEGTAAQEKKHMQRLEAKAQREVAAEVGELVRRVGGPGGRVRRRLDEREVGGRRGGRQNCGREG